MMPASDGPRTSLPGSSEWQTWHLRNTSLPAAASPPAIGAGIAATFGLGCDASAGAVGAVACAIFVCGGFAAGRSWLVGVPFSAAVGGALEAARLEAAGADGGGALAATGADGALVVVA